METTARLAALGVAVPQVILPMPGVDLSRWAVVACDQYTSQPAYWREVETLVGEAPSTLRLTFPEIYLGQEDAQRIDAIHRTMAAYLAEGVLAPSRQGIVLTARRTGHGVRLGLVLAVDLEQYDFQPGAGCAIRPTEGTILDRLPPRMRIRKGGALELPHVMLLADDPDFALLAPLYARRETMTPCYDVALMMDGGHLAGWWVPETAHPEIAGALEACMERGEGLLFAVGDGNHSLATARQCWLELRAGLSEAERAGHPARWALAEVVNLHDAALCFEPIHRALFGVNPEMVRKRWEQAAARAGLSPQLRPEAAGESGLRMLSGQEEKSMVFGQTDALPLAVLQDFLDEYLNAHPEASIDYIHGEEALRTLCKEPDTLGFLLEGMEKERLFPHIARNGVLPRKAFSMGEAQEKRYYMEARKIVP